MGKDDSDRYKDLHTAAVIGDTVGDPLKDTSGPALNILMKLMSIISVVFAPTFMAVNNGQGLISLFMPAATPISAFTNLAVVGASVSGTNAASNLVIATVFLAGAVAGMGGLFIHSRINTVMRESLKSPLLACKVENVNSELRESFNGRP